MKYLSALLLSVIAGSGITFGVPASKDIIRTRQSDGNYINIRLSGDEHAHIVLSEDGYPLLYNNKDGIYYFATISDNGDIMQSSFPACNPDERNSATIRFLEKSENDKIREKAFSQIKEESNSLPTYSRRQQITSDKIGLFPGSFFPTSGNQKAIVILVEYADVKFNLPDPHAYFSGLLNEKGFSEYGATGSAAEWFSDNSAGKFTPQFDVYGPITLSAKRSYYGGNNNYGRDLAPHRMAVEACNQLDSTVDFSEYDADGDGYIDNIFIFYAGTGENRTGEPDAVWPHTSWVTELEFPNHVYDGVILDRYACTNEWFDGNPDGIGTFCHEFSHVLGLPDLYNTSDGSMGYTPGTWSVMDYGPYLNDGRTPPLYSSFERFALGWLDPEELQNDKSYSLPSLASNRAFSATHSNGTEFFLFENRQPSGWDRFLPGHGMLVWHIDYDDNVWDKRTVNNDENHQHVDLIEADNIKSGLTRAGDSFPGTAAQTEFTPLSSPSFKFNDGSSAPFFISAITERPGSEVTFRVGEGSERPDDISEATATDITATSVTLKWTATESERYLVALQDNDGNKIMESDISESFIKIENLNPESKYLAEIKNFNGVEESVNPASVSFTTTAPEIDYYKCSLKGVSELAHDSFTLEWDPLPKAEDYLINICSLSHSEPYSINIDFTDGIRDLPEGWTTSSRLTYASNAYSGESPLSLRFSTDGDNITSALLDGPLYSLSFWMRGSSAGEDDRIAIEISNNDQWIEVADFEIPNTAGGTIVPVDLSAFEGDRIRIVFHKRSEKASVAIDDIFFEWGGDRISQPLPEWTDRNIGGSTSFRVTGLDADTEYKVSVKATDGSLFSAPSDEMIVKTLKISSVSNIETDNSSIKLFDSNGLPVKNGESGKITLGIKSDGSSVKFIPSNHIH